MKNILIGAVFLLSSCAGFSQNFKLNFNSGIDISNLQNTETYSGKWAHKTGSVTGLRAEYAFNNAIAFTTGLDYLSVYYCYEPYATDYDYMHFSYWPVMPYQVFYHYDFLRLPASVKLSFSNQPSFFFSAGSYYARVFDRNERHGSESMTVDDTGFSLSHGAEYFLNDNFSISAELRYTEGLTETENMPGQNGTYEFLMGLAYTFGGNNQKSETSENKSGEKNLVFDYRAGIIYAGLSGEQSQHYKSKIGFSGGAGLKVNLSGNLYFETALMFQRKSYGITDSSSQYHIYKPAENTFWVDARTDLDYLNVPLILSASGSKPTHFHAGAGFYGGLRTDARTIGYAYQTLESPSSVADYKYHLYDAQHKFFKKADVGFIAQAGFQLAFSDALIFKINTVFEHSFISLAKNTDDFDYRMQSLALHAGLIIPF